MNKNNLNFKNRYPLYQEIFDKFDVDNNGEIEYSELREIVNGIDNSVTEREVREMFEDADQDRNGVITFEEFVYMMESIHIA